MQMIRPEDVERRILCYYEGDLNWGTPRWAAGQAVPSSAPHSHVRKCAQSVLIVFPHGLGDAVQLTIVLKHLRHFHQQWSIDIALAPSLMPIVSGLCRQAIPLIPDSIREGGYDRVFNLTWDECRIGFPACPSSKASQCIRDVFSICPKEELCNYSIDVPAPIEDWANEYLSRLCRSSSDQDGRFRAVILHYQGRTSRTHKDLSHDVAAAICETVLDHAAVPLILDRGYCSPLPDNRRIHRIGSQHDPDVDHSSAAFLAALIGRCSLFVGIDSGPLHVAGATRTPCLGAWIAHHPVHFFDLAENVLHLVPENHALQVCGQPALDYFRKKYRHRVYSDLKTEVTALVESQLTGEPVSRVYHRRFLEQLSPVGFGPRYYHEAKSVGRDYLQYRRWHDHYGSWLTGALQPDERRILDAGCASGAITRALLRCGSRSTGVDANEYMIQRGREKWPEIAESLHVCDLLNLHLWTAGAFDVVHVRQVLEEIETSKVPAVLRELRRVTRPGGLLLCVVRTKDAVIRSKAPDSIDAQRTSLHTLDWWRHQLETAGWRKDSDKYSHRLSEGWSQFPDHAQLDCLVAVSRSSAAPTSGQLAKGLT